MTTTTTSQAIREHHAHMLRELREHVAALTGGPSQNSASQLCGQCGQVYDAEVTENRAETGLPALVALLRQELGPHAQGEERYLYPAVAPLIAAHGQPTATMSVDHEFLTGYIDRIDAIVTRIPAASAETRAELQRQLTYLTLQLAALVEVHLAKEERIYLPLFERYLPPEEQQRVLDGMHAVAEAAATKPAEFIIDARTLPPPIRHPSIFEAFDSLPPGESFILENGHDPVHLRQQFEATRPGRFTWEYLSRTLGEWRIRIGKVSLEP